MILLVTRWAVLAVAAAGLVFFAPSLFGGARSERLAMARLEGLAAWTESLRDTIAGAVGLEQAIPATAAAAAPAIREELTALSDRLRVRTPLPTALQQFADDLDDSSADLIVAALMLNSQLRGPGLRDVLTSLAASARDELEMRRRVNAGRASTRRSVQIVMGITIAFVLGLTLFNQAYVEPYSSPVGQLVLRADPALLRRRVRLDAPPGRLRGARAVPVHLHLGGRQVTAIMLVGAVVRPGRAAAGAPVRHRPGQRRRGARAARRRPRPDAAYGRAEQGREGDRVPPRAPDRLAGARPARGARLEPARRHCGPTSPIMGGTVEGHLGMSVLAAVAGLFAPTVMLAPAIYFFGASISSPLWLALVGALLGAVLPTLQLQSNAKERRRDFRHVVSSFLDLVSMNLAGGRGVPEALQSAVSLSNGWGMVRIRETLQNARLQGVTPWAALGDLGQEIAVEELRDLAAALSLVAEDGAKVRESLAARAVSMRQRELADAEGRAAQRSQSMLIAQLLLCVGFLLFLIYPPISQILGF